MRRFAILAFALLRVGCATITSTEPMAVRSAAFGRIVGLGVHAASGAMSKYPVRVSVAMVSDSWRPGYAKPPSPAVQLDIALVKKWAN